MRAQRKANPVANSIILGVFGSDQLIVPKVDLQAQALDGYQANVTVFDCVNLISRACAGIPWVLMEKGATKSSRPRRVMTFKTAAKAMSTGKRISVKSVARSEIENHRLLTLLERPNDMQGGFEYAENVFGFHLISGNSFETYVTPDTGPNSTVPFELWTLRPDRVKIVGGALGSGYTVGHYEYWAGIVQQPFARELILHQKFFSPLDDFYGLSPIQVAARVIDGDNKAVVWNHKILSNSGVPPGMLVIKGGIGADARDRLKEELESRITSPQNARRPLVGEGDIDWKQFAESAIDLDWLEGRKQNRREIARAYNVAPELVGDAEVASYASKEQARKGLYEETCLPLMDRRRDNLNNWLVPLFGDGLFLDYDRDQVEALHEDNTKQFIGLKSADWLSCNDKRAATGYDEYTGDPDEDDPATVPEMLLNAGGGGFGEPMPGGVPGERRITLDDGVEQQPGEGDGSLSQLESVGAPVRAAAKGLTASQRRREARLNKKLKAIFKREREALARHVRELAERAGA